MTKTQTRFQAVALIAVCLAVVAYLSFVAVSYKAKGAQPNSYTQTLTNAAGNAIATTSPVYMTAGAATTTLTLNSNQFGDPNVSLETPLPLVVQLTASSTATKVNISFEYAADAQCVDWYGDNTDSLATTSQTYTASYTRNITWSFASSSLNGAPIGALNNLQTKLFMLNAPVRCVRAVFTLAAGSTGGAIWPAFIVKKQVPQS